MCVVWKVFLCNTDVCVYVLFVHINTHLATLQERAPDYLFCLLKRQNNTVIKVIGHVGTQLYSQTLTHYRMGGSKETVSHSHLLQGGGKGGLKVSQYLWDR